jgi:hypothetical protein
LQQLMLQMRTQEEEEDDINKLLSGITFNDKGEPIDVKQVDVSSINEGVIYPKFKLRSIA